MQTQDEVALSAGRTGMARQSLRVTMLLGMLITIVGGTGIFAVFTDRATTGTNSVETGARPSAVNVRIAEALVDENLSTISCDVNQGVTFTDDLATGIFSVENLQPDSATAAAAYVCLENAGSGSIDIRATVIELVDTDTACTGDEADAGDATCGGGELGELSGALMASMSRLECGTSASTPLAQDTLAGWPANPDFALTQPLAPNDVACVAFLVWLPSSTPEATIQVTQSDKVEWRFAFDATLTP
jgi:hypothetical protein